MLIKVFLMLGACASLCNRRGRALPTNYSVHCDNPGPTYSMVPCPDQNAQPKRHLDLCLRFVTSDVPVQQTDTDS